MTKRKPMSPIEGRWNIVSMTEWDEDYLHEAVQAYIEFEPKDYGTFQFGYVWGEIDSRFTERDGNPAVEFSWEGNDESDSLFGRGWAVLEDGELNGIIFIHNGEDSEFVAQRAVKKIARKK